MADLLTKIKQTMIGIAFTLFISINCIIVFIPIFIVALFKLFPNKHWRLLCSKALNAISSFWVACNSVVIYHSRKIEGDLSLVNDLSPEQWYMVVSNHQSWLDILAMQKVFNYKIPMLKFFIKDVLKWIPLLGFAWWALDCPFMKRHSKEYLKKHPEQQGKDLAATKRSCEKFKDMPIAIMNFLEGTRFTKEKQNKQKSPYQHLLKPKAGGIALVLNTMGEELSSILDVTIIYPSGKKTFWDFMCGRIEKIKVLVKQRPIPEKSLYENYFDCPKSQQAFREWVNTLWQDKDALLEAQLNMKHV